MFLFLLIKLDAASRAVCCWPSCLQHLGWKFKTNKCDISHIYIHINCCFWRVLTLLWGNMGSLLDPPHLHTVPHKHYRPSAPSPDTKEQDPNRSEGCSAEPQWPIVLWTTHAQVPSPGLRPPQARAPAGQRCWHATFMLFAMGSRWVCSPGKFFSLISNLPLKGTNSP